MQPSCSKNLPTCVSKMVCLKPMDDDSYHQRQEGKPEINLLGSYCHRDCLLLANLLWVHHRDCLLLANLVWVHHRYLLLHSTLVDLCEDHASGAHCEGDVESSDIEEMGINQKSQQSCAFVAQIEHLLLGLLVHEASQLHCLVLQLVLQLA